MWAMHSMLSCQATQMSKTQETTVSLVFEEAELAVEQGAEHAVVKDAKIGPEVLLAAAHKSRVGIGVATMSEIQIA